MALVNMVVAYASFYDEKLPPGSIALPHSQSFAATTGGFPHEMVLTTVNSFANVSQIVCRFHDAKHVRVERQMPDDGSFLTLVDCELERGKDSKEVQELSIPLDPNESGKSVREIRVQILSGYSEFVGVFRVDVVGKESMQKIAVLESKGEIDM